MVASTAFRAALAAARSGSRRCSARMAVPWWLDGIPNRCRASRWAAARRRLSYRCVDRASHRDLHGGGGAHEHRIGATGTRIESSKFHGPVGARRIAWFGFILGLIPRPPVTVRRLARTRAEVPARSPVNATNENGVSWVSSRTVTPPPSPISGCSASWVLGVGDGSWELAGGRFAIHATMTTVAAIAVSSVVGARVRDGTS